jgi:integrase
MATVTNRGTKDRPNWYCRYLDLDGKRKNRPTHQTTKAAALRYVAEIEARVARGQIGILEPTEEEQRVKTLTVAELAERFLKEYDAPRLKDRRAYMQNARTMVHARLLPYPLATLAALKVKKLDVVTYRDALRRKYMPATVNLSLAYLHRIFAWAIDAEIIDCRNPVSHVERMRTTPSDERYSREHCERLLGPDGDPMIAAALLTGMRRGELRALRWADVRFDLGCIEIKRSFKTTPKSGKARTIPLHSDLAPILREWQARCPQTAEAVVFPVQSGGKYRAGRKEDLCEVRETLQAAGCLGDLDHPWHAMRHTFATLLAESGASIDAIARILGHSTGGHRITAGYVHTSLKYLASEIEKLRLVPGQPAHVYRLDAYRQIA